MKSRVIAVIMGGGKGERLFPLTKYRCKPAASLGGKYRLVDVPISNCLHVGYNKIFLLTQYNTASLHRHIHDTYRFDIYSGANIEILSPQQFEDSQKWYDGTADSVRKNLDHFGANDNDLILILSGDQLYNMDLQDFVEQHRQTNAEVTIAAKAVPSSRVSELGVMRIRDDLTIIEFVEKPKDPKVVEGLVISEKLTAKLKHHGEEKFCLANMGIYVFNKPLLYKVLRESDKVDFGKHIIPGLVGKAKLFSYIFDGYWEDIGTVRSYFDANLNLTDPAPDFDLYNPDRPIYTHSRFLPAPKITRCQIERAIISDGSVLTGSTLERCVIGLRAVISEGAKLKNVLMLGNDHFETEADRRRNRELGRPDMGIGKNCVFTDTLVDKNARIGDNVILSPAGKPDKFEAPGIMVRDGVLLVHRDATIPGNTVV